MHCNRPLIVLMVILAGASIGCQSHEAKVANLQKQYDQLGQQYRKDCFAEVTEIAPKPSPKCADEKRQLDEAWNRLQAEQPKK